MPAANRLPPCVTRISSTGVAHSAGGGGGDSTSLINGRRAAADGPIKTFPLRRIKASAPYLHHGRRLTLDDAVEFFNLVLGTRLTEGEKKDLLAFLRAL